MAGNALVPAGDRGLETTAIEKKMQLLMHSQSEVGRFLEISYLQLKDHPVQAKEVRISADSARMQHEMTAELMTLFMVTAEFVSDKMFAMMRTVMKEKKSKIIRDIIEQIQEKSEDMKGKATKAKDRYYELRAKIQRDIGDVNKRNKEVVDQRGEFEIHRKELQKMFEEAEREQAEMARDKERKEQEYTQLQEQRDAMLEKAVPSEKDTEFVQKLFDGFTVPKLTNAWGIVESGFGAFKVVAGVAHQGFKSYQAISASDRAQTALERTEDDRNKLREQIRERKETTFKRLAEIEHIDLQNASLGDIRSLEEASSYLGQVDSIFGDIIQFWSNLSVFLEKMHNKTGAGKVLLKQIKKSKYAAMFEGCISDAEKEWVKFGRICRWYAEVAGKEIPSVYRFLSSQVDRMDVKRRQERIMELSSKIESDVKALEF